MTECERIIREGILPDSFFEEEIICDFHVTKEQKKIWAICLDLLFVFDSVCRRHNLRYSLAYGSILGIIRHHGFIPWDDDIDVMMPRDDYDKLRELKSEFGEPYFLQYPCEDKGYYYSFAKLRNSNTTSISWPFRYEPFNQGMFLDIFPLDNYNSINIEENKCQITRLIAESSALMRRRNPNPDDIDKEKMSLFPVIRDGNVIASELDNILRQYNNTQSDSFIIWCNLAYSYDRMTYPKDLIFDSIEVDFYNHAVFIPRDSDKVLKITYGDYMKLPPKESRGTWHSKSMFNPDVPFKEALNGILAKDSHPHHDY